MGAITPDENPADPAVLDGQLEATQSFHGNRLLSRSKFTYEYVYTVARNPGEKDTRRSYGAVLRSSRTETEVDGGISVTIQRYDNVSGQQTELVKENLNGDGQKELHRKNKADCDPGE